MARAGLPVRGQVANRPVGLMLGLDATLNPFVAHPSFQALQALPLARKVARLRDPTLRATLLGRRRRLITLHAGGTV